MAVGVRDETAREDMFPHDWENMFFYCDDPQRTRRYMEIIKAVFDNTVEGIVITDAAGTIRMVNSAFSAITGYSREEIIGGNPRVLKSDRQPKEFYDRILAATEDRGALGGGDLEPPKERRGLP